MTRWTFIASLAATLAACLPIDTRRPPGELAVSVHGNQAMADGIPETADGWTIGYDRFLVTIGHTWPAGDACETYSEAAYDRIVDARRTAPQKLAVLYAEGRCGVAFAVAGPSEASLVTAGVSDADKAFLRQSGTPNGGIAMHVEARATRGSVTKRFVWSYRRHTGYYCGLEGETDRRFVLRENENASARITLRGEALFELDPAQSPGTLRFDPFAAADDSGDGDGVITASELEQAPSTNLDAFATLGSQLEGSLFPAVAALEQGPCETVPLNDLPREE